MATTAAVERFEAGYGKYFGQRFGKLTNKTTENEIKEVYQEWASQYDKVRMRIYYRLFIYCVMYHNTRIKEMNKNRDHLLL